MNFTVRLALVVVLAGCSDANLPDPGRP